MKFNHSFLILFFTAFVSFDAHASGGTADWGDLSLRVVNFVLLVGIITYFAKKPVTEMLRSGIQKRSEEYYGAKLKNDTARKKLEDYEKKISSLTEELATLKVKATEDIENERRAIIDEAKTMASAVSEQTETLVEGRISQARRDLIRYVVFNTVKELKKDIAEGSVKLDDGSISEDFITTMENKLS